MQDAKAGFDILINGIHRTFRDRKNIAYEAARFLKSRNRTSIVEIVDCLTGQKAVMLEDGRLG
jgi:hypothetical protein